MPRAINPRNEYPDDWDEVGDAARAAVGHRCVRCRHPYRTGAHGKGEWTPCDLQCKHGGPFAFLLPPDHPQVDLAALATDAAREGLASVAFPTERGVLVPLLTIGSGGDLLKAEKMTGQNRALVAQWRILTVHHLDGDKSNCSWWNLLALCQRCHLTIQSRVNPEQPYMLEHSDWFKPYAAGFYAKKYEGREISREEALGRLDELLAKERIA